MTEFALILPLLLAFVGITIDFARLFQAMITLEGATRDAAEYVASNVTDATQADAAARRVVCLQAQPLPGFQTSSSPPPDDVEGCVQPVVTVVAYSSSTTAPGATTKYPLVQATVTSSLPFSMLFQYPLITQAGTWTLQTTESFSILQGRQ